MATLHTSTTPGNTELAGELHHHPIVLRDFVAWFYPPSSRRQHLAIPSLSLAIPPITYYAVSELVQNGPGKLSARNGVSIAGNRRPNPAITWP